MLKFDGVVCKVIASRKNSVFKLDSTESANVVIRMREYTHNRKIRKPSTLLVTAARMKCPCGGCALVSVFPSNAASMKCTRCSTPELAVGGLRYAAVKKAMNLSPVKREREETGPVSCRDATAADISARCLSPAQIDDLTRAIDDALQPDDRSPYELLIDATIDTHESLCLSAEQAIALLERYTTPCIREAIYSRVLDVWAMNDVPVGVQERRLFLYGGFVPSMTLDEWIDYRTDSATKLSMRNDFVDFV